MLTISFLAIVHVLSCCATPLVCANPEYAAPAPMSQDVLRADWQRRFGTLPDECRNVMGWVMVGADELKQLCGGGNAGCVTHNHGCPVAYARAEHVNDRQLYAHELAHALLHCVTRDGDALHARADIWGAGGFVQEASKL